MRRFHLTLNPNDRGWLVGPVFELGIEGRTVRLCVDRVRELFPAWKGGELKLRVHLFDGHIPEPDSKILLFVRHPDGVWFWDRGEPRLIVTTVSVDLALADLGVTGGALIGLEVMS